jgi:uncharacterized protein YndB with AHSA1/START domain
MTNGLRLQLTAAASPAAVWAAFTDPARLAAWFAEHAEVALAEARYDFWGRFTPEAFTREQGHHPVLSFEAHQQLRYAWRLRDLDTTVDLRLKRRAAHTLVVVHHHDAPRSHDIGAATLEDFWFLSLENLRRHLDGRSDIVRCDFSAIRPGDIYHTLEIDGPREAVFDALIRPEQLNRWIASQATVEPRVGGRYDLGWAQQAGALKILDITPNEKLALEWPEGERSTVVTWTLEGSGGKTRLTLVHSGFAPDEPTGGLNAGWLNFMSWVKSIVEYGAEWQAPLLQIPPGLESIYAASIRAGQSELILD